MQTTIHREVRTSRVTTFFRRQPRNDRSDFRRFTEAFHWNSRHNLSQNVFTNRVNHVGADVARADGVDRYAFGGHFLRQRHAETVHTGFGSGVVGLASLAFFTVDGADVDDAAPAFVNHVGNHLFGHIEHAVEVGFDHAVPVFTGHFQEHAVFGDTGVVHQDVDHTVLCLGFGESFNRRIPRAHIAHRSVKRVAQSGLLGDPFGVVTRRAAAGDDFEAFFVKTLANGGSDAAHTASDVSYFSIHDDAPVVVINLKFDTNTIKLVAY